jgi:hypothetical protein
LLSFFFTSFKYAAAGKARRDKYEVKKEIQSTEKKNIENER